VAGIFLSVTLVLYAVIGVFARTADANEYYVAGRRIPSVYNGMATAADWMSAASFISLAGGLYSQGFSGSGTQPGGLAYVLGWTGGFCLVALLVAPYLRSMNLYTVPDFSWCGSVGIGRGALQLGRPCCALSPMWLRSFTAWV